VPQEESSFADLEAGLADMVRDVASEPEGHHAIVVVPSLSFDSAMLAKVPGVSHYEERLLAMLLQLRSPRIRLVFCSSVPIADSIVDYYLGLIPAVPVPHSRARLTMISCDDPSARPLSQKLLERADRLDQIRAAVAGARAVGLVCNNTTRLERALAVELGIPLIGNPPGMEDLGTKSGSRETFREAGVDLPDGFERLHDMSEAAQALAELKARKPGLARAVLKLEEGFSGEGNAVFDYRDIRPQDKIESRLETQLRFQAAGETLENYARQFAAMGGIVEEFLPGVTASPSGQAYIGPLADLRPLSTHDQVLGGEDGQVFLGSTFPAHERYRRAVQEDTMRVGQVLRDRGARGRFAVDFVEAGGRLPAIEINLRKGGTTHSMLALAMVSGGRYEPDGFTFVSPRGIPKAYYSTDNLSSPAYRRLTADDVVDTAVVNHLAYDPVTERGCIFHLFGALPDHGKLGVTCIGDSVSQAHAQYSELVRALDERAAELAQEAGA
jgi:hypothetical protein